MSLFEAGLIPALDADGDPISGAIWRFYLAGTNTPVTVFAEATLSTPLGSSVTANAAGRFPVIYFNGAVRTRAVLSDGDNVLIPRADVDPINANAGYTAATRDDLAAISGLEGEVAFLSEAGREGFFVLRDGDAPADPLQGIYIEADGGGYWQRLYDGVGRAEWFGGKAGDTAVDSIAAINAALTLVGWVRLGRGTYYGSTAVRFPNNTTLEGAGQNVSGISSNSPTAHLLDLSGPYNPLDPNGPPLAYSDGITVRNIVVQRSVNPTTPASAVDDVNQGHGIRMKYCSNPVIENVYTSNNLVDVFMDNVLGPRIRAVRGLRLTGTGADRWTGMMLDGRTVGPFGGPSGFPSARIEQIQMANGAGIGTAVGYHLRGALADVWMEWIESAGCHTGLFGDFAAGNISAGDDVFINNQIHDGYKVDGVRLTNLSSGTVTMDGLYATPPPSASGNAIRMTTCAGVTVSNYKSLGATWANAMTAVSLASCQDIQISGRVENFGQVAALNTCSSCDIDVVAFKDTGIASTSAAVTVVGGGANRVKITAPSTTLTFDTAVALDGATANCFVDASGCRIGSVTNRVVIAGVTATSGAIGTHYVISPGF